uniref:Uncharacterized protein n=1 Tax=Heterorhabditis bacteriophora TaxID=37862 RepID=A0A1I7X043_HETBA
MRSMMSPSALTNYGRQVAESMFFSGAGGLPRVSICVRPLSSIVVRHADQPQPVKYTGLKRIFNAAQLDLLFKNQFCEFDRSLSCLYGFFFEKELYKSARCSSLAIAHTPAMFP